MSVAERHAHGCVRRPQSGLGLLQVMLVLLLVGSALAVGALLLQSRRTPQQAVTQEQTLRWTDEAIAAFATANARLPCPSSEVHGEEDCNGLRAQGWLPMRTLLGASGTAPQIGPVAYMVYRGGESEHLDLTRPGNAYQPPLIDGSIREIVTKDEDGEETGRRPFPAVNGLDLCRSLELAEAAGLNPALARVTGQNGTFRNVAYGVAAAGPQSATTRLDGANAGTGQSFEAPWREWDPGYDDRVRVRSFNGLGQALGCRLLAGNAVAASHAGAGAIAPFAMGTGLTGASIDNTSYNVSLAAMDVLAASITLHDSLAALQATNVDATEAAVDSAVMAQISLVFKLVITAASISDQISTMVTSAVSLTRAIATCIASLGVTCWEVPLKAAALGTSIAALGEKGVALAAKAASLPFAAMALDASVKARDLARKAATPPATDLEGAIEEMECTLFGTNCPDDGSVKTEVNPDWKEGDPPEDQFRPVYRRDANGNPVPVLVDGLPATDSNGNPIYEVEYEPGASRKGLHDEKATAKSEWDLLQKQVDYLEDYRLAPWGISVLTSHDANGDPVDELQENGQIRNRINEARTISNVCNGNLQSCRYGKEVRELACKSVGANNGEWELHNSECVFVGSRTETDDDDEQVTVKNGDHDQVEEVRYEFNLDLAIADTIARRNKAQEWVGINLREEELKREIKEFEDNYATWFTDSNSILGGMKNQRDDAQHCGASPATEMTTQKCVNAEQAVIYIEECRKPEIGPDGEPIYTQVDGKPVPQYARDANPLATCKPNMWKRLEELRNERDGLSQNRSNALNAYNALPSPFITYPPQWFERAIETIVDDDGNPIDYRWEAPRVIERYYVTETVVVDDTTDPVTTEEREVEYTRGLPYYAPEPYDSSWGSLHPNANRSSQILVHGELDKLNIFFGEPCSYRRDRVWRSDWWWMDPYTNWRSTLKYGLYCQRYPYNRGFEDWKRAKIGANEARKNYSNLEKQYDQLHAEYEELKRAGKDPEGAAQISIGFGAEPALERADARGSVGPHPLGVQP